MKTTPKTRWMLATLVAMSAHTCVAQSTVQKIQRRYSGKVIRSFTEPWQKSVVAGAVIGVVTEAVAKEGDRVQVGDPLVKLNRRVLEASLEIAKARAESTARVDAASAQFSMVKSQLTSLEDLKAGGHTNRYELEQKQAEYQQVLSDFRAAQDEKSLALLEVKRIEAELEDRMIRSPIAGFITEIHKQPGEQVSNTEPEYATIVSLEKLRVRFYVDAALLRQHSTGDVVVVNVGANQKQMSAVVSYVSPTIDSDSGVGRLEVLLDNQSLTIQSGVVAFWNDVATKELARRVRRVPNTAGTVRMGQTTRSAAQPTTRSTKPPLRKVSARVPAYQHRRSLIVPSTSQVGRATLSARKK